jgi:hypothetical protein
MIMQNFNSKNNAEIQLESQKDKSHNRLKESDHTGQY